MKRRTLNQLRSRGQPEHHHNVYVVLLDPIILHPSTHHMEEQIMKIVVVG